jgi:uncharacterized membrane protein YuzA (DUF378 family)
MRVSIIYMGVNILTEKNTVDWIALLLVIIGGLNWGLIGLFNLDLVQLIFGSIEILQRIIYIVVGLAAVYLIYFATKK